VEAGLASSAVFRDLCKRAVVAVLRSTDPYQLELRKEVGLVGTRFLAILFDARGETLACGVYPAPRPVRTADAHDTFVDEIGRRLSRAETLQELHRRWEKAMTDGELIQSLALRYLEIGQPHRVAELCEAASAKASPGDRFELRRQAYNLRVRDVAWTAKDSAAPEKIVRDGEWLLKERPDHPDGPMVVSDLFNYGLCSMFDVPAKAAAVIQRLSATHADLLKKALAEWKESREDEVRMFPKMDPASRAHIGAQLGDAERTIAYYTDSNLEDVRHLAWLNEAKARLAAKK